MVSDEQTRVNRFEELREILTEKGYPQNVILNGIKKASNLNRHDLIHANKVDKNSDVIVFTSTFNPNNPRIDQILKDSFQAMQHTDNLQSAFSNKRLLCAKRKSSNIKQLLTTAAFSERNLAECGIKRCKDNCVTCQYLVETTEVIFKECYESFKLKYSFNCNSKNVIYLIKCKCLKIYIGECISLKQRLFLHKSNIKNERNRVLPVSKHIYNCSGGEFKLFPFYKMNTDDENARKAKEAFFINKYKPELNG